MSDGKWTYNLDSEELWCRTNETFDTREEALAAAKEAASIEFEDIADEDSYRCRMYTGQMHDIRLSGDLEFSRIASYLVESAMEYLGEHCFDLIGEAAECWPYISTEDEKRAEKAIERVLRWLVRRSGAKYQITDIQEH